MSDDQRVEIKIEVEGREALAGLGEVGAAFEDLAAGLQQSFAQLNQKFREAIEHFGELQGTMVESGKRAEEMTEKMRKTAIIMGLVQPVINLFQNFNGKIKETINATVVWTDKTTSLSRTLGVSTEKTGGLTQALNKLRIETDTYRDAAFSLQRSLESQEEAFNRNGIVTRDASGEMLNMQDIMMSTIDRPKSPSLAPSWRQLWQQPP